MRIFAEKDEAPLRRGFPRRRGAFFPPKRAALFCPLFAGERRAKDRRRSSEIRWRFSLIAADAKNRAAVRAMPQWEKVLSADAAVKNFLPYQGQLLLLR